MDPSHSLIGAFVLLLAGYQDYKRNRVSDHMWLLGAAAHAGAYAYYGYRVTVGFALTPVVAVLFGLIIRRVYSIGEGDILALAYLSTFTTLTNGLGVFLIALGLSALNMRRTWQPQPLVSYMAAIYILKLILIWVI